MLPFFPPQEEARIWAFFSPPSPNHHLCSLDLGHFPVSAQTLARQDQTLRQPFEVLEGWIHGPVLSFPPQGGARSWELPPDCVVLCWGRDYGETVHCVFLLASMQPLTCSMGLQEPLDWSLHFFPKRIDSPVVVESLCP